MARAPQAVQAPPGAGGLLVITSLVFTKTASSVCGCFFSFLALLQGSSLPPRACKRVRLPRPHLTSFPNTPLSPPPRPGPHRPPMHIFMNLEGEQIQVPLPVFGTSRYTKLFISFMRYSLVVVIVVFFAHATAVTTQQVRHKQCKLWRQRGVQCCSHKNKAAQCSFLSSRQQQL